MSEEQLHGPLRQSGQAVPLLLVLLLVLCAGLLVTFNTGQVVGKKVELTNAADAAAYSIAVEQARARNLAAYLNRGRVANEVAIAQMVSLNSWVTMIHSTSNNFQKITKWAKYIPYIGPIIGVIDKALKLVNKALKIFRKDALIPGFGAAIYSLDRVVNLAYAKAAEKVLGDLGTSANIQAMAGKVVKDNAPNASISVAGRTVLARNAGQANNDLTLFNPKNGGNGLRGTSEGGERYRNLVMESRDRFTRDRATSLGPLGSNGGTDLVEYDRWSAVDVHEFKLDFFFFDIKIPLGWGGTQATDTSPKPKFFPGKDWRSPYDGRKYRAYNGVSNRSIAGKLIENDPASRGQGFNKDEAYFTQYKYGITHKFYDVKKGYAETPGDYQDTDTRRANAGPIFTVEVTTKAEHARTSSAIGIGSGRMQLKDKASGGEIRAMASAQVYFNRPHEYSPFRRGDGKFERGSMFSPYWQARLVETPAADKALLLVIP